MIMMSENEAGVGADDSGNFDFYNLEWIRSSYFNNFN